MISMRDIEQTLTGRALVQQIDHLPRGHARVETGFLYPDGSNVDVFVVCTGQPGLFDKLVLSDLGQTTAWLLNVQVKPWLSKKRQAFLQDAIDLYGVTQNAGELQVEVDDLRDVPDAVVRLGQACIRVADLSYTRRSSMQSVFGEEIEELIADLDLSYQRDVELTGRYSNPVRVDFLVRGARSQSAVLMWSTGSASSAHTQANEIFRKWYDLDVPGRSEQRVTVFDDRYDVYRDDDEQRLRGLSQILPFGERDSLADLLAA